MPTPTTSCSAKERHTFASSSISAAERESGVKTQASVFAVIGQAYRLLARRFVLYAIATVVCFGLTALCAVVLPIPHGLEVGLAIFPPLLTAFVYAFVWNDARETPYADRAAWERFLERAWAVIVIDFLLSFVLGLGLDGVFAQDATGALVGFLSLTLTLLVIFSDAVATVDDDGTVWSLVPRAFFKSVAAAVNPRVLPRAGLILALSVLVALAQNELVAAFAHARMAFADFWAFAPLGAVTTPPLAALTLLVYQDAGRPASARLEE
ncbi:MAG: hypothetical protein JO199_12805 [Candidatus Eremiobacteraeota bacterium]|nr:hypothetical protein [Candidatus Eremiobacteraeota bacterium]